MLKKMVLGTVAIGLLAGAGFSAAPVQAKTMTCTAAAKMKYPKMGMMMQRMKYKHTCVKEFKAMKKA